MRYRRLGRTGLEISEVGYGAWGIGGSAWIGAQDDESLRAAAVDLTSAIYASVAAADGSISAEHGLGRTKAAAAASYKSDVAGDLMRAVTRALDPEGLMNPGVLLPPA